MTDPLIPPPLEQRDLSEAEQQLLAARVIQPLSIPELSEGITAYIFTPPEVPRG